MLIRILFSIDGFRTILFRNRVSQRCTSRPPYLSLNSAMSTRRSPS